MNVVEKQPNESQSKNNTLVTALPFQPLDYIYPVGSIYITTSTENVCPLQRLGVGKWELCSKNMVLQGADETSNAGKEVEAGLPNITGNAGVVERWNDWGGGSMNGAFTRTSWYTSSTVGGGIPNDNYIMNFNASRSNAIYGNSDTVQPPALLVNIWKRVA